MTMKVVNELKQLTVAYHGTDRMDFDRFDIAEARIFNVGLHFGTRAAAESSIAYLREESPFDSTFKRT